MFARIHRARFQPEHSDEVVRVAQESLDTFRGLPGFEGVTYLYDRDSGWGAAVSRWASEADASAADGGLASVIEQFAAYWAGDADSGVHDLSGPLPVFEVIAQA